MTSATRGIEFFTWNTPNGHKVGIALKELGLEYTLKPINIMKNEQFKESFMEVNPKYVSPVDGRVSGRLSRAGSRALRSLQRVRTETPNPRALVRFCAYWVV